MEKNNGLSLRVDANSSNTTTSSSSDLVLQWGNRKRLRCMKLSGTPPVGQPSISARVDRRVVRSTGHQNMEVVTATNAVTNGHGYINLRRRSSSPAHRVLRNCDSSIAMKGQINGGRGVCSPDGEGVHDKRGGSVPSETAHDSKQGAMSPGNEAVPIVWPPKFVIGLTNKEKEEDFLAIKGSKLPQRPKKRAKFIQRTINSVIPGGWLSDLTLERYEVKEKKITKKLQRPRGLKAMGSIESESE
ncbi:hypothetical protein R6Q59_022305 [Mikania micrantha]